MAINLKAPVTEAVLKRIAEIVSLARSLPVLDKRDSKEISDWLWEDV